MRIPPTQKCLNYLRNHLGNEAFESIVVGLKDYSKLTLVSPRRIITKMKAKMKRSMENAKIVKLLPEISDSTITIKVKKLKVADKLCDNIASMRRHIKKVPEKNALTDEIDVKKPSYAEALLANDNIRVEELKKHLNVDQARKFLEVEDKIDEIEKIKQSIRKLKKHSSELENKHPRSKDLEDKKWNIVKKSSNRGGCVTKSWEIPLSDRYDLLKEVITELTDKALAIQSDVQSFNASHVIKNYLGQASAIGNFKKRKEKAVKQRSDQVKKTLEKNEKLKEKYSKKSPNIKTPDDIIEHKLYVFNKNPYNTHVKRLKKCRLIYLANRLVGFSDYEPSKIVEIETIDIVRESRDVSEENLYKLYVVDCVKDKFLEVVKQEGILLNIERSRYNKMREKQLESGYRNIFRSSDDKINRYL